jgi:peptidoglycan hydrolase-like protein with peptidoglycan-binding domain
MKLQENVVSASTFPLCAPLCTPRPPFVNHFSPFRATFFKFFSPLAPVAQQSAQIDGKVHKILKFAKGSRRYPYVLIVKPTTQTGANRASLLRTRMSVGAVVISMISFFTFSTTSGASIAHAVSFSPAAPAHTSTTKNAKPFARLGDKGQVVRSLQQALVAQGISVSGGVDGIFGQGTLNAVKTFQSNKGLIASGEVNSTTAFLLGLAPSPALPTRGQRGALVTSLQQSLVSASISVRGGVDGIFGAGTTAAVSAYQTSRGLAVTGKVDIATAISLGIVEGTTKPATTPPSTIPATTTPSQFPIVGNKNEAVKSLQKALIAAKVPVRGGADGHFGPATTTAVTTFQQNMRIATTGVVDQLTSQFLGLTPAPVLPKMGDTGESVKSLQNLLITAGIAVKGGADGKFGAATKSAISAFQKAQGLTNTGSLNLQTALYVGFIPGLTTNPANNSTPTTTPTTTPAPSGPAILPTVFPVLGPCWFADTWKAPRAGGRQHEGVDIIAKSGTPIYAVSNGTITRVFLDRPGSLGGNAIRLTASDGTYFHYAHLSAFAEGAGLGATVVAGQVIGYIGSTGSSSTPHLHFEYHPGGGAASNPYPLIKPIDGCKSTTPPTTTPATIPVSTPAA